MSTTEATAEVLVTAFKSLKRREREAVLERLLLDKELIEDVTDTLASEFWAQEDVNKKVNKLREYG